MRSQSICLNILFDRNLIKVVKINRFFHNCQLFSTWHVSYRPRGLNSFFLKTCFVTLFHLTTLWELNISLSKTHHYIDVIEDESPLSFLSCTHSGVRGEKKSSWGPHISPFLMTETARMLSARPRLQTPCPTSELARSRGRAKIDNDIICNVDHVCVKPDDGTRQIHIKIFYKYTRLEYRQQG